MRRALPAKLLHHRDSCRVVVLSPVTDLTLSGAPTRRVRKPTSFYSPQIEETVILPGERRRETSTGFALYGRHPACFTRIHVGDARLLLDDSLPIC